VLDLLLLPQELLVVLSAGQLLAWAGLLLLLLLLLGVICLC
jgi:hypothetical protein